MYPSIHVSKYPWYPSIHLSKYPKKIGIQDIQVSGYQKKVVSTHPYRIRVVFDLARAVNLSTGHNMTTRDEWIPLFSYIRIHGYLGYWFFLDTWIIGYLDIMHTWIHGYLDTWISIFFGYMDTWILWISNFFIIQILDILSKYPDIFRYSF